jgi:hypothetical protein
MTQDQIDTIALGGLLIGPLETLLKDHHVEVLGANKEPGPAQQWAVTVRKGIFAAPGEGRKFTGSACFFSGALANAIAQACRAEGIDVR